MSEYASVIERVRRAFASVSKLEGALARDPMNSAIQVNLIASQKIARKSEEELLKISQNQHVDICNYRLISDYERGFKLFFVSKSLMEYQNLFSQIYDSIKNGPKGRAQIGSVAAEESAMEVAYTYSGSLGFVFFAHSEKDFFEGNLDSSISALFEIINVSSTRALRDVAKVFGNSVVKRLYDWSSVNIEGNFSADLRWNRSDGRVFGQVIERNSMNKIVDLIVSSSDEKTNIETLKGILVGGDLRSGTFHFIVLDGGDYKGQIGQDFNLDAEMILGRFYLAKIRETSTIIYATDRVDRRYELLYLMEVRGDESGRHL